jgi:nitric oxide reductase activation protein
MARAQGVGVIGIGVGRNVRRHKMTEMFGADGFVLTDSDNLVSELVGIYADELDYETPPGY